MAHTSNSDNYFDLEVVKPKAIHLLSAVPTPKSCNYTRKSNRDRLFKSNVLRVITIVLRVIWPIISVPGRVFFKTYLSSLSWNAYDIVEAEPFMVHKLNQITLA